MYDIKMINKAFNRYNCPSEYWTPNVNELLDNDYSLALSIREQGKTTGALLLGLVLFKLYGTTTVYMRNDNTMVVEKVVSNLYGVIQANDYIARLYDGEYNDVEYRRLRKAFYLIKRDVDGEIVTTLDTPICEVLSCENWQTLKSGYNNTKADYIIFDEFLDTNRDSDRVIEGFFNNISTITRSRPTAHCLMLSNNVNKYSFWWSELTITKEISLLEYGKSFKVKTELGSSIYCEMLKISDRKYDALKDKSIRFFGFNTNKMAQFNGLATWQGRIFPHAPHGKHEQETIYHILHRGQNLKMDILFYDDGRTFLLITPSSGISKDYPVLTLKPSGQNEILLKDIHPKVNKIYKSGCLVFSDNNTGLIWEDFERENYVYK